MPLACRRGRKESAKEHSQASVGINVWVGFELCMEGKGSPQAGLAIPKQSSPWVPAAGGRWCKGWMGKSYLRKQKPQLLGLRQPREGEETSSMPSLCYGAEGFPGMRSILICFSTCICNSPWKPSRLQIISWSPLLRTGGKATQKSAGFMRDWEKKAQHPFPACR